MQVTSHDQNPPVTSSVREPLVTGGKTYGDVTYDIARHVEGAPTKSWMIGLAVSISVLLLGGLALVTTLWEGIGTWGLNKTVGWAWDITNFVWWVGIGHAGTLISAVLLLFRQKWRTSINRAAEAMTIFAVMCAALFPLIHMGRPWIGAIWVFPLPNTFGSLWVNFNSPLLWDVFAISTYFSVSLAFWFIGLIPDFATIRDRATGLRKTIYGALSMGWDGAAKSWMRYESVSLILAGLATPLVLSVHTIVSMDFATSVIPGWHTTIFPPYFVAGGKMVVCQPGITEVAKSMDTIVCTERTRGVAKPARIKETDSYRIQLLAAPSQPILKAPYIVFLKPVALSRMVAKSGIKPINQNARETEK